MAANTHKLLCALLDAEFQFVVIGGTAALAHGVSTPTLDLDIAAPFTRQNIERLLAAIMPFRPHFATRRELGVVWQTAAELEKFRLMLLETDLGRLDVLSTVEPIGGFEQLEAVEMELMPGRRVRVLSLDQLIEVKAHLRRPKDKIVEAELRVIRERISRE